MEFIKKTFIGIAIFLTVIALCGCGQTPEQEAPTSAISNTPVPTVSPLNTPLTPTTSVTIDMILIPAGEFEMGGEADQAFTICQEMYDPYSNRTKCKSSWFEDEEPIHTVYLDDYYIDKFEVTNFDYQLCVEDGECSLPDKTSSYSRDEYYGNLEYGDYPVIHVNWHDAQTYCEWRGARLPTEAEWEKSARGTDGRLFPWGSDFNGSLGNICGPEGKHLGDLSDTTPVGSYPNGASPYGVMDMAGNVYEWTADWYGSHYYEDSPSKNPTGPAKGSQRVMRGSNFECKYIFSVHITERFGEFPDYSKDYQGFRCASSTNPNE